MLELRAGPVRSPVRPFPPLLVLLPVLILVRVRFFRSNVELLVERTAAERSSGRPADRFTSRGLFTGVCVGSIDFAMGCGGRVADRLVACNRSGADEAIELESESIRMVYGRVLSARRCARGVVDVEALNIAPE